MAWTIPEYNRNEVNRCGLILTEDAILQADYLHALEVVNNWRAIHACPLQTIRMTLARRAISIDSTAIISQRTKRIPAIELKLIENHKQGFEMKLTQMHDIGGCRAVLKNVGLVEYLASQYADAAKRNPNRGSQISRIYDYIAHPKDTGYRGIHIVFKYKSEAAEFQVYNDLKIEIQIRTRLQHYWATAIETVDFYTGQALKSNLGQLPWKRFFVLVANEFARLESRPLIPGAPTDEAEGKSELRAHQGQIIALEGFHAATKIISSKQPSSTKKDDGQYYLLQLDLEKRLVTPTAFRKEQLDTAQKRYLQLEAENKDRPSIQTVLVSVDSVSSLQKAYPSFYLDISEFVKLLKRILGNDWRPPATAS